MSSIDSARSKLSLEPRSEPNSPMTLVSSSSSSSRVHTHTALAIGLCNSRQIFRIQRKASWVIENRES